MNVARPLVLDFTDTEADDLYDILAKDAACRDRWDVFAPPGGAKMGGRRRRTQLAAATCAECPVFAQCERLAAIVQPTSGVWAGRLHSITKPEGIAL